MHRIDGDGAVANKNGVGFNGFDGAVPNRTVVTSDWLNDVQENVARAITGAGISLVKGTFTQLYDAIVALVASGITGKVSGPSSATDNAIARFDGTTGKLAQNSVVTVGDAGDVAGVGALSMSGEVTYSTPKSRTLRLGGVGFVADGTSAFTVNGDTLTLTTNSGLYVRSINQIPPGSTITAIRVLVTTGATRSGANRMQFTAFKRTGASLVPTLSLGSSTQIGSTQDDGGASGIAVMSISGLSEVVSGSTTYWARVQAGNNASSNNDGLADIEIDYTDVGPRNLGS